MEFPKDLRQKIINHLRRIGYLNQTYKSAMEAAHRERGEWECAGCKKTFKRSEIHGDHIEPVINPDDGFVDWNTYLERLFLGQIQPLCKQCHNEKTRGENSVRAKNRRQ